MIPNQPLIAAARMYEKEPCGRTLEDDLEAFLHIGVVFSTPTAFIMAKLVPSPPKAIDLNGYEAMLADPWSSFDAERCDTWLIWLAAGSMKEFFDHDPRRGDGVINYLAWARRGRLRWHPYQRTLDLCTSTSTRPVMIAPHNLRGFQSD